MASPLSDLPDTAALRAGMVTKEIRFVSVLMPSKNRTTVGLVSKLQRRLATTALLGFALVRFARASAANHRESIIACRHDDLGVANDKVTIEVTDSAIKQGSAQASS